MIEFLKKLLGLSAPDRFARRMIRTINQFGSVGKIRYDKTPFRLVFEDRPQSILYLGNAYEEYQSVPENEKENVFRKYAGVVLLTPNDLPKDFDQVRSRLYPMLRERVFYEFLKIQHLVEGSEQPKILPQIQVTDELVLDVVYDSPSFVRNLTSEEFSQWKVTVEDAAKIAVENLLQKSVGASFNSPAPGYFESAWQDSYDATRLILADLIRELKVKGEHVAMIPNRELLLVTGSEDSEGLLRMARAAKEALGKPRAMTGFAYQLLEGKWTPFLPSQGDPAFRELRHLRIASLNHNYAQQKELLKCYYNKLGKEVSVAAYMAIEKRGTGEIMSICVWSKGAPTLLPRAEYVGFVELENRKNTVIAPWDQVRNLLGHLMKPQEFYPERYLVDEFPSPEQLLKFPEKSSPDEFFY